MATATSRPRHRAYKVIAETEIDQEEGTLSEISIKNASDILEPTVATFEAQEAVQVGSLSRSEHHSWYFSGHGAVDAILTLGPLLFLVVGGLCLGLNNKPVSEYGEKIKAITLLSPTLFPIIYAAILGKMLRRLGLFKAERGTTIGDLERLIGCQSIFSTLERQVGLRGFDFLGVAILFAWLLSPLGGQASLRLLSTKPSITSYNTTVTYYPVEEYPKGTYIRSAQIAQKNWNLFAPLYVTAVQTSRQSLSLPMDLFGNVKVPDMDYLNKELVSGAAPDYDWHYITNTTKVNYTSIFGVPVLGIPDSGNCSFNLMTHYWAVSCTNRTRLPERVLWRPTHPSDNTNLTDSRASSPTFQIRVDEKNSTDAKIKFDYLSRRNEDVDSAIVTSTTCLTSSLVVESRVDCCDKSCRVHAIRRLDREPADIWKKEHSPLLAFRNISQWMPGADLGFTQGIISTSELIEHWMLNTDLDTLRPGYFVDFEIYLSNELFSSRLQTAINTFWDATIGSSARRNAWQPDTAVVPWNRVPVQATKYTGQLYVCNPALAVLTIAISLVLFVAANISMLLGLLTRTPDILGFVSVSARDNPYFKRHVTSYLSGLETARALRNVRVRVGDVKSQKDVGHIAFATMDADGPQKLSWTRLYD
ncbi:hypothetical protein BKA66DRAFT_571743 [Pyrenochaeta sp. MPI-SDFR-AT-0127]|nr:hypothetical protein BKA66DRAFT_571743 [Pyrenochaeta sp. MPI-SDFR-AT-0127]